jgi:excisionase family DNA binding protein
VAKNEECVSTSEAASYLGITRQRVLQLIESGRLEATKFANVYMIRKTALARIEGRKPGRPRKATKINKKAHSSQSNG